MTGVGTETITYTTADIAKVLDCFAADFDMMAQATGLRTRNDARATSDDVKTMAIQGYLEEVNVYLEDESGRIVRAVKYEVSTDAGLWTSQRPGNNLWPRLRGGKLIVHVIRTEAWWQLSERRRAALGAALKQPWGSADLDTTFPMLTRRADRDYASHNYGMRKSQFQ
jgi:hypothetical protein